MIANGYLGNATAPTGAPFVLPTNPVQYDEKPNSITRAPQLGEHTDDVLRAAGLDDDTIIQLKIDGAIL